MSFQTVPMDKRGTDECALYTFAVLADLDYLALSQRFKDDHAGQSWSEALTATERNTSIKNLNDAFIATEPLAAWCRAATGLPIEPTWIIIPAIADQRFLILRSMLMGLATVPVKGSGRITLRLKGGAHVIAYKDGLIYDMNLLDPIPIAEFDSAYIGSAYFVQDIFPLQEVLQ